MKIIDVQQGTPEWLTARLGKPTASNFDKVVTLDGLPSKQVKKYIYQLAGEAVSGQIEETYTNKNMERGKLLEDEARKLYELTYDVEVQQVGFCLNERPEYGCSPDGLVGDAGLIEIKCPLLATHVGYLIDGGLPSEYFQQTQGQLLVTGREWLDFLSYYPGLKPLIVRVQRDEKFIKTLKTALTEVCSEVQKLIKKIR